MTERFDRYLRALVASYGGGDGTEHSGRSALQALLDRFAAEVVAPGIAVQHEPKRDADKGAPDFKVRSQGMILGYIEVKRIDANLNEVIKSAQIKKYRLLSDNILVTDYLEFIRLDSAGKIVDRQRLAYSNDLEGRTIGVDRDKAAAVSRLLSAFFSSPPQGLRRSEELSVALATRAKLLRDYLAIELQRQKRTDDGGRLHALFEVFRTQVFHELELKEFADAFAQMLAYGLFLAKLNAGENDIIVLDNVRRFIPGSFSLIRELVRFLEEMQEAEYDEAKWVVEEILSIVNGLAIESIREDLSFRNRKAISRKVKAADEEEHRLFERDPFIYFYEDFLKAYDKDTRKSRGVYYTPPPVVNFIVRAVDDILTNLFEIEDGVADHRRVTVLDFAAGTGTFLLEVMQRIFDRIGGPESGKADAVLREHMLRNLYGFEYLIAPYTIAHLKLSQYLKDRGHPLADNQRLKVFLTNTLEPVEPQHNAFLPALSEEVERAQAVKDRDVLVILGNPPYSGHSKNAGTWIRRALDDYKYTVEPVLLGQDDDGQPVYREERKALAERNPKWLNDDYVKFIRFAQMKMDAAPEGIVGIITNHSWLDNPTFRGMRQSLMRSFDQIYVVDLHGSTKPKEPVPEGVENDNVFDIQKGVAITLLVKRPGVARGVWHTDIWGSRLDKYKECASSDLTSIDWSRPQVVAPYYLLSPLDWTGWDEYGQWWQVADSLNPAGEKRQIFDVNVLGFQTHRDHFAIAFTEDEMRARVADMVSHRLTDAALADRYDIKDNRDWSITEARAELREMADPAAGIINCAFRPFDNRPGYFGKAFMDYPRREMQDHVAGLDNIVLLISRQIGTKNWRHSFAVNRPAESCIVSDGSTEQSYCFPLHLFAQDGQRRDNLSADFRTFIDRRYDHHYSAQEIAGYIYAILHAPSYRSRYAEFLRIDFPRVPFPKKSEDFEILSSLGWALLQAHLMNGLPRRTGLCDYHGRGGHNVDFVRWSEDERISINERQSFAPVPKDVWDFHIGSYRVIEKYLKSRQGRTLSLDEINQVATIAGAARFTVEQMARIDQVYTAVFPAVDN
nr:DNA methyltransferase [Rhizobium sp. TCK]